MGVGGGGEGLGLRGGGTGRKLILVRSSDRCCIPLNMKMNKYLHQFSFAVMLNICISSHLLSCYAAINCTPPESNRACEI